MPVIITRHRRADPRRPRTLGRHQVSFGPLVNLIRVVVVTAAVLYVLQAFGLLAGTHIRI